MQSIREIQGESEKTICRKGTRSGIAHSGTPAKEKLLGVP